MAHYELARNLDTYADDYYDDDDDLLACPKCDSLGVFPTLGVYDEEGLREYRCRNCGHYFVDD